MNQNEASPVGRSRCPGLRRKRGETLAETLISLLVASAAMLILAGGIATGAKVNKQAGTDSAVVFPTAEDGRLKFRRDDVSAVFRLSSSDAFYDPETNGVLYSSDVQVRKILAKDNNPDDQTGITWRTLYIFELRDDVDEPQSEESGTS